MSTRATSPLSRYRYLVKSVLITAMLLPGAGCGRYTHPAALPDYGGLTEPVVLDFSPDDSFTVIKPMFLVRQGDHHPSLSKPGIGAPSLSQFFANPDEFDYVERLVPSGTVIRVVANKDGGLGSLLTYVTIGDSDEWVWAHMDEWTKLGQDLHFQYNREYFRKLEEAPGISE